MQTVWADGGYAGQLIAWVWALCQWALVIVKRTDDGKGFSTAAQTLGGRTDLWLVGELSATE